MLSKSCVCSELLSVPVLAQFCNDQRKNSSITLSLCRKSLPARQPLPSTCCPRYHAKCPDDQGSPPPTQPLSSSASRSILKSRLPRNELSASQAQIGPCPRQCQLWKNPKCHSESAIRQVPFTGRVFEECRERRERERLALEMTQCHISAQHCPRALTASLNHSNQTASPLASWSAR